MWRTSPAGRERGPSQRSEGDCLGAGQGHRTPATRRLRGDLEPRREDMDRRWAIRRRTRLSVAAVAVVVALCALLPATAAANTTSLTLVASPVEIPYNGSSILTGTFMDTTSMTAVGGLPILVQSGPSATGPWTDSGRDHDPRGRPRVLHGDLHARRGPARQDLLPDALPRARPASTRRTAWPSASRRRSASASRRSRRASVTGSASRCSATFSHGTRPRLTNVVKFRFYRYTNGVWKYKFSRWGKTSNYLNFTKVTKRVTITRAGKWKVRRLRSRRRAARCQQLRG